MDDSYSEDRPGWCLPQLLSVHTIRCWAQYLNGQHFRPLTDSKYVLITIATESFYSKVFWSTLLGPWPNATLTIWDGGGSRLQVALSGYGIWCFRTLMGTSQGNLHTIRDPIYRSAIGTRDILITTSRWRPLGHWGEEMLIDSLNHLMMEKNTWANKVNTLRASPQSLSWLAIISTSSV